MTSSGLTFYSALFLGAVSIVSIYPKQITAGCLLLVINISVEYWVLTTRDCLGSLYWLARIYFDSGSHMVGLKAQDQFRWHRYRSLQCHNAAMGTYDRAKVPLKVIHTMEYSFNLKDYCTGRTYTLRVSNAANKPMNYQAIEQSCSMLSL